MPRIGTVFHDHNMGLVAEKLIGDIGLEVLSFKDLKEALAFARKDALLAVLIEGGREDPGNYLQGEYWKDWPEIHIFLISTFVSGSLLSGRVRIYPASFLWREFIRDLQELLPAEERGKEAGERGHRAGSCGR